MKYLALLNIYDFNSTVVLIVFADAGRIMDSVGRRNLPVQPENSQTVHRVLLEATVSAPSSAASKPVHTFKSQYIITTLEVTFKSQYIISTLKVTA